MWIGAEFSSWFVLSSLVAIDWQDPWPVDSLPRIPHPAKGGVEVHERGEEASVTHVGLEIGGGAIQCQIAFVGLLVERENAFVLARLSSGID
jgi:hypothetical protein